MRVAFIVNPRSGAQRSGDAGEGVLAAARDAGLAAQVFVTAARGDGERLAREAAVAGFPVVAAVGGDGTANEVACGLLGSSAALAVVPRGSGNGFARDIGMSLDLGRACRQLASGRATRVDVGELDGRPFLMSVGFGIDARIVHEFHRVAGTRRGQWPYFTTAARCFWTYRPPRLTLIVDGVVEERESLVLVAANTRQFGAGAVIAPAACHDDGHLVLVSVPRVGPVRALHLAASLFSGSLDLAPGVEMRRVTELRLQHDQPIEAQLDGEPVALGREVVVRCRHRALNLWSPGEQTSGAV